ncbi:hypothetical protein NEOKW01_2029 [Nematocida sp. AWRm80]|nr:hypothetical protein NEOKW01_2029 [Nematocida sp. AWRm80]
MVFSIELVNRPSKEEVNEGGKRIRCPICEQMAKIIARRNTKALIICSIPLFTLKKHKAYPACSNCLNALPSKFSICNECQGILPEKDLFCSVCTVQKYPEE